MVTAVTAQNTLGVRESLVLPESVVAAQLRAIFADMGADIVKTGMLGNAKVVEAVGAVLRESSFSGPLVVDPVIKSTSGKILLNQEGLHALKTSLFPLATLVTPNLPEAEELLGRFFSGGSGHQEEVEAACREIKSWGPRNVLIKGGHGPGDICGDCLLWEDSEGKDRLTWFKGNRIETINSHGTGCVLSSAIACLLGQGKTLPEAVDEGKLFVTRALEEGRFWKLGKGIGPLYFGPWPSSEMKKVFP